MKICHVYKDFYPPISGGIEKNINLICRYLKKDNIPVEVLIANRSFRHEHIDIDGIPVTKVGQWGRFMSAPITRGFSKFIQSSSANIFHFHHPNPTAELAYLRAGAPGKMVVTYHSDIVRQALISPFYRPFLMKFLSHASSILVTSPIYLETSAVLASFKDKCKVVPLGIELDAFQETQLISANAQSLRAEYPAELLILFVGKLRYYKGLHVLIQAMKNVPNAKLLVVGSAPKAGGEQEYRQLIESHQLQNRIFLLGEVPDNELNGYYHACDVFCLPSILRSEAFGLVQLEAFACGKPVISSNLNTGIRFVNQHNLTGYLFEPNNVNALAETLNLCVQKRSKLAEMGLAALKRVHSEFSAEIMFSRIKAIYQELDAQ